MFRIHQSEELKTSNTISSSKLRLSPVDGLSFLHHAVKENAIQVLAYLLIDQKADPNVMSAKTSQSPHQFLDMSALHMAVQMKKLEMVDLILMSSSQVDIDLFSETHGTPLIVASKVGDLKIAQRLIIRGAKIDLKDPILNKTAKELTENQKIVYLLEKYEYKPRPQDSQSFSVDKDDAEDSSEEEWLDQDNIHEVEEEKQSSQIGGQLQPVANASLKDLIQ